MEKILDIHIIYCDKDKKYLNNLLEQCKNFKIVNARNNWKIFVYAHDNSGENNIGQFQRRLEIIRKSPENHYIWFIDGDDEIIDNADLMEGDFEDVDILVFGHQMSLFTESEGKNIRSSVKSFEENIVINCQDKQTLLRGNKNITLTDLVGGSLWNKWVKVTCWKGVYEYLHSLGYENIRPNASEDCFFSFYAIKYCRNLLYVFKEVYYYHNERSSIFNDEKYVKYENFLRFRAYHKEITNAIKKLNMGIITNNFLKADICCHTQKALSCLETKKALDDIAEEFGKDLIIKNLIMGQYYYLKHPYVKYLAYKYLTKS